MRAKLLAAVFTTIILGASGQMYYPPLEGDEWEATDPSALNFCPDRIDSLYAFLEEKNTFSFIMLKEGRMVLEQYFGNYTQNSIWYWASAGKTLTAYLVGCAQEDGLLDIDDPTQLYLGEGWTTCTPAQEEAITIRHQLSMISGLNDEVDDANCLDPECLEYLVDPGERWAYYNAPYRLLLDVLSETSGQAIGAYTTERMGERIGMGGFWLDYVRWGKARDMARFGLLSLNQGVWETDTVLSDATYLYDMVHPSQDLNRSYGYLWWLNGQEDFMLPGLQLTFGGSLIPDAPDDMYSALGLNDQKIYVVPSQDLVVVRQGNSAGEVLAGPSSFDNQLWQMIEDLVCEPSDLAENAGVQLSIFPNPVTDEIQISTSATILAYRVRDIHGRPKGSKRPLIEGPIDCSHLAQGVYLLELETTGGMIRKTFVKN
ncbi:MAG: serine hydrolase [Flavobacteriales bacterium]|nr:serine hydrolase [Flavobacteriales bacterium]